jgi:hypothetical protein
MLLSSLSFEIVIYSVSFADARRGSIFSSRALDVLLRSPRSFPPWNAEAAVTASESTFKGCFCNVIQAVCFKFQVGWCVCVCLWLNNNAFTVWTVARRTTPCATCPFTTARYQVQHVLFTMVLDAVQLSVRLSCAPRPYLNPKPQVPVGDCLPNIW